MPEGVEVKQVRNLIAPHLEGKTVKTVQVVSGRYTKQDPLKLGLDRLENCTITHVLCKGKLLVFYFLKQEKQLAALSTFGMTGFWVPEKYDRHPRIAMHLTDGSVCTYSDPRNFGTFKIVSAVDALKKLQSLGSDILSDDPKGFEIFAERMYKYGKNQILATALLDQRIACGSGNYIRADAMYLAELNPNLRVDTMSISQMFIIWLTLRRVALGALANTHPVDKHLPFSNVAYNRKKGYCGGDIENFQDKLGRTVWWSPTYQA
jgi:formamidopyrimidine-DNA glycosylase